MENNDLTTEHGIHLEKTYFGNELMTSDLSSINIISSVSLSFLNDTGWY